jgi:cation transport ATPase
MQNSGLQKGLEPSIHRPSCIYESYTVTMVNDGVNGTPALAEAIECITMGASGMDVTIEAAEWL